MRLLHCVFLGLAVACSLPAQTYTISTYAGGGRPVNIPGTSAYLPYGGPGFAVDDGGNVFFTTEGSVVLRLDAITGILSLVAGNWKDGFSGDNGPATSAQLRGPRGVAVDSAGNLYIADTYNDRVRKVSGGVITTVAELSAEPISVAVDSAGDLYVIQSYLLLDLCCYAEVFKVSGGVITSVVGTYDYGDGTPAGIAVDSAGNLYIAESDNHRIRKVSDGVITTVAGNGTRGFSGDNGPATSAQLFYPSGVAVDSAGNLFIADSENHRIRKVSGGVITTVAGNGRAGFSSDNGPATSAQLFYPSGVAVDSAGNLFIADSYSHRLRIMKVSGGVITTVAGGFSDDNGPATSTQVRFPSGVAVDSAGNLYIAEAENFRIRKVSDGVITTVAGNGTCCFSGDDGPATSAQLSLPRGVAVDSAGNLYITDSGLYIVDSGNERIRKVSGGVITTVAGNGTFGYSGDDGPATSAQLNSPDEVAVDSAGNLYIADISNHRIRKVSNGVITTVAGNGTPGFSGDNGPATSAQLNFPTGVAVDSAGNLYIADFENHRIRKVSDGMITTVAGNGTCCFSGDDGPATSTQLGGPQGIAVDSAGNLYIADPRNHRIRKVSNGVITTVAGNGTQGFSGDDGPATSAQLNQPMGIAVDSAGNIYVGDYRNNRVRILRPQPQPASSGVINAAGNRSSSSDPPR